MAQADWRRDSIPRQAPESRLLAKLALSSDDNTHNNAAERALRGVAIGRKNYLHVGSDAGGHTAAVMYTLLGTARLNGINPQRYLRHVLERIGDHPSNRIDELLPWAVAAKWADEASAKELPLAA